MKEKAKILLADDEKINLDLLVSAFEEDYDLYIATSGVVVFEILKKVTVDLMLLDIMMPIKDGFTTLAEIKANPEWGDIPVIFLSAQRELDDKKRGFALGATDYMTKPLDIEELKVRVRAHLSQHRVQALVLEENRQLMATMNRQEVQLVDAYEELEKAYLETIERLSRAAEYRDDQTGGHVKRVGNISAIVAAKMGYDQRLVHAIRHAAPLHDIGKIGIPEGILLKDGPLNEGEWTIMKSHTAIGKEILKDSSSHIIRLAEVIAYTHHERWDGQGYPLGLKGDLIPEASRIVAIADVFDALTTKRPYKRAFTFREALDIIMEEEDGHFQPEVLNAFLSSLDEIETLVKNRL